MGIAITIPNADFNNLYGNQITDLVDTPVTNISIFAQDYYIGSRFQLSVNYEPLKTNKRGVIWELVNGSEYAALDKTSGTLDIFNTANGSIITVKATSIYNDAITAEKNINGTYRREADADSSFKTLGKIGNVTENADIPSETKQMLVREANASEWTLQAAPPKIVTNLTEDEVNALINAGTIDNNTLYFCSDD